MLLVAVVVVVVVVVVVSSGGGSGGRGSECGDGGVVCCGCSGLGLREKLNVTKKLWVLLMCLVW